MTDIEFWELIALIDVSALEGGEEHKAVEPLQAVLSTKSEQALFAFEEVISQKLYVIDGEEFADCAGDSGDSDDGFLYAPAS
jgi:cobalamin biosynthesis Co2+ chelatase CbiK